MCGEGAEGLVCPSCTLSLTLDPAVLHTQQFIITVGSRETSIMIYYTVVPLYTSAKIIQVNEYGCRDAPCEKSWKQGNPLSNSIKDTSTNMRNPLPELHVCREGLRMIVLVSLIVLLRGFPCFHDFSHGASLHPYSFT